MTIPSQPLSLFLSQLHLNPGRRLHAHFNHAHHYPIVLFVDDVDRWAHVQFIVAARVHLVQVDDAQWSPQQPRDRPAPQHTFRLRSVPEHKGFSLQYRRMSRYSAGFLLGHPALARFDYVIKLDPDTRAYADWADDPFARMHARGARWAPDAEGGGPCGRMVCMMSVQ